MFKGFFNFFNKTKAENDQLLVSNKPIRNNPNSKLKGKMIKDYILQDTITSFQNPYSELVSGLKQNMKNVSIYAIEKKYISEEFFVIYQNAIAQNIDQIYPKFLQIVQSISFIYIIFEEVKLPEKKVWTVPELIDQITNLSKKIGGKINGNGLLINQANQLVYLHAYQPLKTISKFEYESKNRSILADFFCRMIFIAQQKKKQIRQLIIKDLGKQSIKQDIIKIIRQKKQNNLNRIFPFLKNSNSLPILQSQIPKLLINNENQSIKIPQLSNFQKKENHFLKFNNNNEENDNIKDKSQYTQSFKTSKLQSELYPDLTQDQEQIQKLLQVVKVNPFLINQANEHFVMRASSRARHQNKQQTKQIDNIIDNTKRSLFEIKVVKSGTNLKSKLKIQSNLKWQEQNKFQVYLQSYLQQFKHFKKTMKSGLKYYDKGYSGLFLAYFITLIGILRRSKLVYSLQFEDDLFGIGSKSINVQKHISKLKRDLLYEAKILTDLRQTIFKCYVPIKTMDIISPFLEDRVETINPVKLQDFCFFYMSSLIKSKVDKNVHFINFIEFMYIILNRNFQIVHFETQTPKNWNDNFFQLRNELIKYIIPNWTI